MPDNPLASSNVVIDPNKNPPPAPVNPGSGLAGLSINSSMKDLGNAAASANADLMTTTENAYKANAAVLQNLQAVRNDQVQNINTAYDNLSRISRFDNVDPGIAQIIGIFDSDWNAKKQENTLAQANAQLGNATDQASLTLKANQDAVSLANTRASIASGTIKTKLDINNQLMQSQKLRLELDKAAQDKFDRQIAGLDPTQLPKIIEQAQAGKGPFAGHVGRLMSVYDDYQTMQESLHKSHRENTQADTKALDENVVKYLSNFSPKILQNFVDQMDNHTDAKGNPDPQVFMEHDGVKISREQLIRASAMAGDQEKAAIEAYHANSLDDNQTLQTGAEAQQTNYGLTLYDHTLSNNDQVQAVNQAAQGDQGSMDWSKNLIDQTKKLVADNQKKIDIIKQRYQSKEAQAGVEEAIRNGGVFTSSQAATPVFSEDLLKPGAAEGAYFASALVPFQHEYVSLAKQKLGFNPVMSGKGEIDTAQLMAGLSSGKVKPDSIVNYMLMNPEYAQQVKQGIVNKSAAVVVDATANKLAEPLTTPNGKAVDDPVLSGLPGMMNHFRQDPNDETSPIDLSKLVTYLYQKQLESGNKIDYLNRFRMAMRSVAANYAKSVLSNPALKPIDRSAIGSLYQDNFGNAVTLGVVTMFDRTAQNERKAFNDKIQQDMNTVSISPNPMFPTQFHINSDNGNQPSATGADLTTEQVRKLMGQP